MLFLVRGIFKVKTTKYIDILYLEIGGTFMKNVAFDNACSFTNDMIERLFEAIKCEGSKSRARAFAGNLTAKTIEVLQINSYTNIERNALTYNVLTDEIEELEIILPTEVSAECVRRLRKGLRLWILDNSYKEDLQSVIEAFADKYTGVEPEEEFPNLFSVCDAVIELYDEWCEIDMGEESAILLVNPLLCSLLLMHSVITELKKDRRIVGRDYLMKRAKSLERRIKKKLEDSKERFPDYGKVLDGVLE